MAIEANIPIVPLFINVPEESNMSDSKYAKNGTLRLELLEEISTKDWSLDNLDTHINDVRNLFVKRFNELNPNSKTT
jgi:putative phosphoserine phosphatase/1-acylglycerol-3-phosphate O-acyltransferase